MLKEKLSGWISLIIVYIVWGSTYLAIRIAVQPGAGFEPFTLVTMRLLVSAGFLFLLAYVTRQKNDFVARVLRSYKIPHEVNDQGVVVRINMGGQWMDVTSIEIVPMLREAEDQSRQVAAHELFFFTTDGILDVVSALTIR